MKRSLAALAVGLALVGAPGARAEDPPKPTGEDFVDLCVSPSGDARAACGAVIVGLIDVYTLLGAKRPDQRLICPTRTLEPELARQLFVTWAGAHPKVKSMDFTEAVIAALRQRYPCTGNVELPLPGRITE